MSIVVGVAGGGVACLATDTRFSSRVIGGRWGLSDYWGKLVELEDGFVAGGGSTHLVLEGLERVAAMRARTPETVGDVLAQAYGDQLPRVRDTDPDDPLAMKTWYSWVKVAGPGESSFHQFAFDGSRVHPGEDAGIIWPPSLPDGWDASRTLEFTRDINGVGGSSCNLIRAVAAVVADTAARTFMSSKTMDLGLAVWGAGGLVKWRLRGDSNGWRHATDAQIQDALRARAA